MSDIIDIKDAINDWVKIENEDVVKISNKLFVAVKSNYFNECIGCDLYPGEGNNYSCLLNKKYLDKANISCAKILKNMILLKGGV